MLEAALSYADKGWPVFPCNIHKRPLVAGGFKSATTDKEQVREWWTVWPDALIGCPTGSDFWVLDVDAPVGLDSLAELEGKNTPMPCTLEQRTGGGGRHLFFKMPCGINVRNSISRVAPRIDVRGVGGYVIVAPSMHNSGSRYAWIDEGCPIADAPVWLLTLVMSGKDQHADIRALVDMVEKAQEGTRNDTLNKAAFQVGKLVAHGDVERDEGERALRAAANCAGLPATEADKTIASGISAGETAQPRATVEPGPLRVVTHRELAELDVPEPLRFLDPIINEGGLTMLFAKRGVGKTWVALCIAIAIACGRSALGRWTAPEPRKVLYVDGEMSLHMLRERLSGLYPEGNSELIPDGNLRIVTPELQCGSMPNLTTPEGQRALAPHIEGVDVVIIDNLATLAVNGSENDADAWRPFQVWLLELRRLRKAVLLVHHAGKNGSQRGTSAKEDILDVVLTLTQPNDYKADQGARFVVDFTKARGIYGDDAKAFEAELEVGEQGAAWTVKVQDDEGDDREDVIRELMAKGMTIRAIADETGMSSSTVGRIVKKINQ